MKPFDRSCRPYGFLPLCHYTCTFYSSVVYHFRDRPIWRWKYGYLEIKVSLTSTQPHRKGYYRVRRCVTVVQGHYDSRNQRIRFKTAVMVYKCIHGLAPSYLASNCKPTSSCPGRSRLRSTTSGQLNFPRTKSDYIIREEKFRCQWTVVWNIYISLDVFKAKLRTFLFNWLLSAFGVFYSNFALYKIALSNNNNNNNKVIKISTNRKPISCGSSRGNTPWQIKSLIWSDTALTETSVVKTSKQNTSSELTNSSQLSRKRWKTGL